MNDLLVWLGVDGWRPVLAALVLPPAPFIVAIVVGARLMASRRLLAWFLILVSCLGLWFGSTMAAATALRHWLLPPVRALTETPR